MAHKMRKKKFIGGVDLSDFFGVWGIEMGAANTMLAALRGSDVLAHMKSVQVVDDDEPEPISSIIGFDASHQDGASGLGTNKSSVKIAVIRAEGVMSRNGGPSMSRGISTVRMRGEIREFANDPSVDGILLDITSPGGTVAGQQELVAEVLRAQEKKPVHAYIESSGCSCAYWLASSTGRITATDLSVVGAIGVIAVAHDESEAFKADNIKVIPFTTGPL